MSKVVHQVKGSFPEVARLETCPSAFHPQKEGAREASCATEQPSKLGRMAAQRQISVLSVRSRVPPRRRQDSGQQASLVRRW
jgi:hypothetical protein